MDGLKIKLDRKQSDRKAATAYGGDMYGDEAEIIDEEEFEMIKSLKAFKKKYKECNDTRQVARTEAGQLDVALDDVRKQLIDAFNLWYSATFNEPVVAAARLPEPEPVVAEKLDDDEAFEQLQMARVMAEEPESLAFVRARKSVSSRPRAPNKR